MVIRSYHKSQKLILESKFRSPIGLLRDTRFYITIIINVFEISKSTRLE